MLRDPDIVYREFNHFHPWVWGIIWGATLMSVFVVLRSGVLALGVTALLPVLFWFLFGKLTVEVRRDSLHLHFGRWGWISRTVAYADIDDAEAVTYRPLWEFGGWGIRGWGKKKAWTTRGDQAVRLELADGNVLYVGSQTPARLLERLQTAIGLMETDATE